MVTATCWYGRVSAGGSAVRLKRDEQHTEAAKADEGPDQRPRVCAEAEGGPAADQHERKEQERLEAMPADIALPQERTDRPNEEAAHEGRKCHQDESDNAGRPVQFARRGCPLQCRGWSTDHCPHTNRQAPNGFPSRIDERERNHDGGNCGHHREAVSGSDRRIDRHGYVKGKAGAEERRDVE